MAVFLLGSLTIIFIESVLAVEFLGWVTWSPWSHCSVSCGVGERTRALICPNSSSGPCDQQEVSPIQKRNCTLRPCPTPSWGQWTVWSPCSSSCKHHRHRACETSDFSTKQRLPSIACGTDPDNYTETCVGGACESGHWSNWLRWSRCDCEKDQQFRRRYCNGRNCTGSSYETKKCDKDAAIICGVQPKGIYKLETNTAASKLEKLIEIDTATSKEVESLSSQQAEHVEWTAWTQWSVCDCYTGRRYKQRMCASPKPPAIFIHSHCAGSSINEADCEPNDCNEVPGGWSSWSEWSDCPQNCGLGCQYRVRMCAHSMPINGGQSCSGNSRELRLCPVNNCSGRAINGQWSGWATWSECSVTCGIGVHSRTRHCTSPFPSNGGQYCSGNNIQTRSCEVFIDCPKFVAGGWSEWTEWSKCDGRNSFSWRSCNEPKPRGVYSRCHGKARRTRVCS